MRISTLNMHTQSLSDILTSQEKISKIMNQISTGKKISSPSDDPVVFERIQTLKDSMSDLQSWKSNIAIAQEHLALSESVLTSFEKILVRIDTLKVQAMNGTLSNQDRIILTQEIQGRLADLVSLANSKDSAGNYIFSGYANNVPPYIETNGTYIFQGNEGERKLQVSSNTDIVTSISAASIFEMAKEGNGTFVCHNEVANTGTGIISQGILLNQGSYIPDNYTINFVSNSQNQLAYYVSSSTLGQILPPLPTVVPQNAIEFDPNQPVIFNGMEISIKQQPNEGDLFYVSPSNPKNILNAINDFINILKMPTGTAEQMTEFMNKMEYVSSTIDQGYQNLLLSITNIGAMMNTLEQESLINEDLLNYSQQTLSLLEDVDMVEVISQYTQQMTVLEAAQMSYSKIQNLSLFNYI